MTSKNEPGNEPSRPRRPPEEIDPETGEIRPPKPAESDDRRAIPGDRTVPSVNRARSLRSFVTGAAAATGLVLIGVAFLAWYHGQFDARADEARKAQDRLEQGRLGGEAKVTPLGRVDPPFAAPPASSPPTVPPPQFQTTAPASPPQKTPAQLELERKLNSPVMLRANGGTSGGSAAPQGAQSSGSFSGMPGLPNIGGLITGMTPALPGQQPPTPGLGTQLQATATPSVTARVLPDRRFLLPKGAFIDCTLETAIDSTLEGLVTCVTASDIMGADGQVVLLERGSKLIGERRGEVRQGQARVFVLWHEARTPTGVVAQLLSPGTDQLGRAGMPGHVDTHFWERFGSAMLISLLDGAIQAAGAGRHGGTDNTNVNVNPAGGREVIAEILRHSAGIPPTVVMNQGERIQVLVARDVDFRPVYELRVDDGAR